MNRGNKNGKSSRRTATEARRSEEKRVVRRIIDYSCRCEDRNITNVIQKERIERWNAE
jgi:hypothetical protein